MTRTLRAVLAAVWIGAAGLAAGCDEAAGPDAPTPAQPPGPSVRAVAPAHRAVTVGLRPVLKWRLRGVAAEPSLVMVRVGEVGDPGDLQPPPADAPGRHLATFTSNPGVVPDRLDLFDPGPDGVLTGRLTEMTGLARRQWHRWTVVATLGRGRVRGSFLFRTRGGSDVPPAEALPGPGDVPGPGGTPGAPPLPEPPLLPEDGLPPPAEVFPPEPELFPPEPELPPEPFSDDADLP